MRDREKVGEPPFFFMYGTGRGEGPSLLDCLSQNFAGRQDQEVIYVIKVALCDDEPAMCRDLKERVTAALGQLGETCAVTCYANAFRLLDAPLDFDLIFLDIQMPGLDGVTLSKKLREKEFEGVLIFVTVLRECMLDAFEVEAMDYLFKPVDEQRLEAALKRSLKRLGLKEEKCLFIQTMNWCKSVRLRDIYYCEVIDRKIYVHTRSGVLEYYGKMRDLEKQTSPRLFRCHRSYLINPEHLLEYRGGLVKLENGDQVPVSKGCQKVLMREMTRYMDQEV